MTSGVYEVVGVQVRSVCSSYRLVGVVVKGKKERKKKTAVYTSVLGNTETVRSGLDVFRWELLVG